MRREKLEGERSRCRTYDCRNCGEKYEVCLTVAHPEQARVCPDCRAKFPELDEQYYEAFGLKKEKQ